MKDLRHSDFDHTVQFSGLKSPVSIWERARARKSKERGVVHIESFTIEGVDRKGVPS